MSIFSNRYSRQILFSPIGPAGQERLQNSTVVIIGCGALGTVQADALCRAGVGKLRLIDRDIVEASNLQRQTLFGEQDVIDALPKAVAAQRRLQQVNSEVQVEAVVADLNPRNIEAHLQGAQCLLDATDNFEARFLVNDAAVKQGIPWIYGAAVGSYGLSMTILPGQTPCLRCVFESVPPPGSSPTCDTAGVLAPIVNLIASIQVAEALKILTGNSGQIRRHLLHVDVWQNAWRELDVSAARGKDCPACKLGRYEYLEGKTNATAATVLCGRDTVQIHPPAGAQMNFAELARRLSSLGSVKFNDYLLRFSLEQLEITLFPDGRALVKGAADPAQARSIYARYIGI